MITYSFTTIWKIQAEAEKVRRCLADYERWPEWWFGMAEVVKLEEQVLLMAVGYGFYRLRIKVELEVVSPYCTLLKSEGDLVGGGSIEVRPQNPVVVVIKWNVASTKPWMNRVGRIGKPFFAAGHAFVMKRGGHGLARRVGGEVIGTHAE